MELQIVVDESHVEPKPKGCCIYNVPKKLRQQNEEAYTPQVVSIGPIHHGQPHLQAMRLTKSLYCEQFCKQTRTNKDSYLKAAKEWEKEARACYEGIISMGSDEFVEMILVDGIFVVEVLMKMSRPEAEFGAEDDDDEINRNKLFQNDVLHDMMLLENQLPLFVIEKLHNFVNSGIGWSDILFTFAEKYFKKSAEYIRAEWVLQALTQGRHLIDFYHIIAVYSNPSVKVENSIVLKYDRYSGASVFELSRSAKGLEEAGVKFKRLEYMLPFDLDFDAKEGILKIPVVTINRWTEAFFTNLIAYEHCLRKEKIITSFVVLMANLVEKPKDVEVLVKHEIIDNQTLGNSEDVCALFRNLYQKSMMNKSEFFYRDLCVDLNNYSRDSWHQWKAAWYKWKEMLHNDYFSSPWSIIALIGAIIALALTVIQTYYSVIGTGTKK